MNEHCGTFNVIDTFTVNNLRQFYFTSILPFKYEYISIKYRPDTNALVYHIAKEKFFGGSVYNPEIEES